MDELDWKCRVCGVEISHDRFRDDDKLCVDCFDKSETTHD